ncbi:N-acyl-D-amino-acid deacylase family protein [Chondromyces apiculatus]|uniref:N-acyl-D-amino-acid deacylase n=1 Tax=Chondromyces apiculatus DSM 436 TaxID=1192034 RepID=A0A017T2J3_9BACT|nr:amidohydrolase family protein [Chondromyces apiculatus]EYF02776.1 N-acyl-D-amino-acid deacylase [Chondromyces apiculatus DSM 436]
MDLELVVRGGTVVDGTGAPRFRADVGVRAGRIVAVGMPEQMTAPRVVDAAGLCVAPGFIDIHSHADWVLTLPDHGGVLAPLVAQGITTVVAGNCGHSPAPVTEASEPLVEHSSELLRDRAFPYRWRSMGEMLDALGSGGLLLNAAFLVGHGTVRQAVMGNRPGPPSAGEMRALRDETRGAIRQGAFGLSAGLAYAPGVFADNEELLSLARVTAEEGAVFTVHGRAFTWVSPFYRPMLLTVPHNLRSVRELLRLGRDARARIQLSHQIAIGRRTWPTHRAVLRAIDRAIDEGVDAAFDAFPYTAGNTTTNALFPAWLLDGFSAKIRDRQAIARLRRDFMMFRLFLGLEYSDITLLWGADVPELTALEGLRVDEIGAQLGMDPFDAYVHLARLSDGKARILIDTYSGYGEQDEPLRATLSHPRCAIETDTILTSRGKHNPASFGTFPRVLGRYARDLGLFSVEEAVRRMTSFPAERIGLTEVGRIAPGYRADLVLFDAAEVADNTRPGHADAPPSGIRTVMISGEVVAESRQETAGEGGNIVQHVRRASRHGRLLRR